MTPQRSVRVQVVIERTPGPPWITELPFPEQVDRWAGGLLSWRWLDRELGTWTGLERYRRDGLLCDNWVHGDLLDRTPVDVSARTPGR